MGSRSPQQDPLGLGVEWVKARLTHDPRTRHLHVDVIAQGSTLVLEGLAPTLADKQWAGCIAQRSQAWGFLDNQIDVIDGQADGLTLPRRPPSRPSLAMVA